MSGLLPDDLRIAIDVRTVFDSAGSFGVVAFVVLALLLLESELTLARSPDRRRSLLLGAVAEPLVVVFILLALARIRSL